MSAGWSIIRSGFPAYYIWLPVARGNLRDVDSPSRANAWADGSTGSIRGCTYWADYPIDRVRALNGGYLIGGLPNELAGYQAGGGILRIGCLLLMGGPQVFFGQALLGHSLCFCAVISHRSVGFFFSFFCELGPRGSWRRPKLNGSLNLDKKNRRQNRRSGPSWK